MKALVYDGELSLKDIAERKSPELAKIRVLKAGICSTDLEITKGYMDYSGVLGHEFVGIVESCQQQPELEGKRVVGEINISPGAVDSVEQRHMADRSVLGIVSWDGCFAEYVYLPPENLKQVPECVSDLEATFVEPIAAALEILEQVDVKPEWKIAILGDGRLGLLTLQVLSLTGAEITMLGHHQNKLDLAKSFGASKVSITEEFKAEIGFDMVVDCSGNPDGINVAMSVLKPRGILVLKTTTALPPDFHMAQVVINEITVVGSRCGQFEPAIRLLEQKKVSVDMLVSKS